MTAHGIETTTEHRGPRFGMYLRAARLGYHWSDEHAAFIRMSDDGDRFEVCIAPGDNVPNDHQRRKIKTHRCWWEAEDGGRELLRLCAPLEALRAKVESGRYLRRPLTFHVGEDGALA